MRVARCRLKTDPTSTRDRTEQGRGWWVQFGDEFLVYSSNSAWSGVSRALKQDAESFEEFPGSVRKGFMHLVVQKGRLFQQEYPDIPVLIDKGRYLVVEIDPEQASMLASEEPCFVLEPLKENEVVYDVVRPSPQRKVVPGWVKNSVDSLDVVQFQKDLRRLVSYKTRHSNSPDYASAAEWVRHELESFGYRVSLQDIIVGDGRSVNVVADLMGEDSDRDLVLVVAHLDSVNHANGVNAPAPGADDNASGSAGALAIARAVGNLSTRNDLRVILFGGEEQGLLGSKHYVSGLSDGDRKRIRAVINMDMIGVKNSDPLSVLLEGANISTIVIDGLAKAAQSFTDLRIQKSLKYFASDHVPFIEDGLPAVLTIEGADGANDAIHTERDTIDRIDWSLAHAILRMNLGFLVEILGDTMSEEISNSNGPTSEVPRTLDQLDAPLSERQQFSGRYIFGGGVDRRFSSNVSNQVRTIFALDEPILVSGGVGEAFREPIRFNLHVDVDGSDSLGVVSGTLEHSDSSFPHVGASFIGQISTNDGSINGDRNLVVENFSFDWPQTGEAIVRLEMVLMGGGVNPPRANVTFVTSGQRRFGPYVAEQISHYFRDVEIEIDREDGALVAEPYDTHSHPDRPADIPREALTLKSVFVDAGIRITRSAADNTISTSAAGPNHRWNEQELHDAMQAQWSAFANRPQWKMWIFMAELADSDTLGGIMFDGDINDPNGVDRQGTAVFTKSPFFHSANGAYPQANPPAAAAAKRELFFNLIHETGHAFNLLHSWQKMLGTPWSAPAWVPVSSDGRSLSWMNYPDRPTPGHNATWFYDRFRFRFDRNELLFLRHAPDRAVQMGNAAWAHNHGRAIRGLVDNRLSMELRTRKRVFELGEPVSVEMKLSNNSNEAVFVSKNLELRDGCVKIAITDPNGIRRPFLPLTHTRSLEESSALMPGESIYVNYPLTYCTVGTPFTDAGAYRVEASFHNHDGGMAAAVLQIYVNPADPNELPIVHDLFRPDVGRAIMMGGSRVLSEALDRIDFVLGKIGPHHPAQFKLAEARVGAFAQKSKLIDPASKKIRVADADPDLVVAKLRNIINAPDEASNSIGHIEYGRVVDTFTSCAVMTGDRAHAVTAQKELVELFTSRKVIPRALDRAKQRLRELA